MFSSLIISFMTYVLIFYTPQRNHFLPFLLSGGPGINGLRSCPAAGETATGVETDKSTATISPSCQPSTTSVTLLLLEPTVMAFGFN